MMQQKLVDSNNLYDNMDDATIEAKLIPVTSATNLVDLETRHGRIVELATSIKELSEMFKDLNSLITVDDVKINAIATNIEEAKVQTEIAHNELVKAEKLKKSNTLLFGILATLVAGPSIGLTLGIKAGVLTVIGSGGITVMYNKFVH